MAMASVTHARRCSVVVRQSRVGRTTSIEPGVLVAASSTTRFATHGGLALCCSERRWPRAPRDCRLFSVPPHNACALSIPFMAISYPCTCRFGLLMSVIRSMPHASSSLVVQRGRAHEGIHAMETMQ